MFLLREIWAFGFIVTSAVWVSWVFCIWPSFPHITLLRVELLHHKVCGLERTEKWCSLYPSASRPPSLVCCQISQSWSSGEWGTCGHPAASTDRGCCRSGETSKLVAPGNWGQGAVAHGRVRGYRSLAGTLPFRSVSGPAAGTSVLCSCCRWLQSRTQ